MGTRHLWDSFAAPIDKEAEGEGGVNVILVDHEKQSLENLEYIVQKVLPGALLASFHHAAHALEYIKTHRMDIAFLDVHVPGADSIALAKTLQQKYPRVNLLFCSDCADYAMTAWDMNCSAYLLKPITEEKIRNAAANLRYPVFDEKRVELRCFGNFEAFCDGSPIQFKYNRTKELLAYLTDRNGTRCSMKELSAVLFENDQHRSYMYQIRLDLVNTLGALGVGDILIQSRGYLGIARDRVKCDYFDYFDHKIDAPAREYSNRQKDEGKHIKYREGTEMEEQII